MQKILGGFLMKKNSLIAIFVALIILWFTETWVCTKTSRVLGGAIDLALHFSIEYII
jgi:hypothetical protein